MNMSADILPRALTECQKTGILPRTIDTEKPMRLLGTASEMEAGKVYNLVYAGDNAAYARINGRRTVLVTATKPALAYVELYAQFVSPTTDDLRSDPITVEAPAIAFAETEIWEVDDESQWLRKSMRVGSLGEAVERGVLTIEDIAYYQDRRPRDVAVSNLEGRHVGRYLGFNVEDKTAQPLLQCVYVWWNTWDAMRDDFRRHGVEIRS